MFRTLEKKWNAHTPVWLHNGTKENYIFQLSLTAAIIGGYVVKDKIDDYRRRRFYREHGWMPTED